MMQLKFSDRSLVQLRSITYYGLESWGQAASNKYIAGLFDALASLQKFPKMGAQLSPAYLEPRYEAARVLKYREHRIIYDIEENIIRIIAVGSYRQLPKNILP